MFHLSILWGEKKMGLEPLELDRAEFVCLCINITTCTHIRCFCYTYITYCIAWVSEGKRRDKTMSETIQTSKWLTVFPNFLWENWRTDYVWWWWKTQDMLSTVMSLSCYNTGLKCVESLPPACLLGAIQYNMHCHHKDSWYP